MLPLVSSLLLSAVLQSPGSEPAQATLRDNVLVILADDMGVERTPAYGFTLVDNGPTPVLDALAARGVLFRNAYSEPLCSPTRSAILTGRHPCRTGIGQGITWMATSGEVEADVDEVSLADALSATHNTYATGYFDFKKNIADRKGHEQVQREGVYATSDQVDDALAVIGEAGSAPWFVWLAFNAPHSPFHVPPADLITLPVDEDSSDALKHRAVIEAMDTEIGRLLNGIPPEVLQRTWVIFLGDNGTPSVALPESAGPAKGTATELGVHVPLLVVGPGVVEPGREVEALVGVTDLYATVCDLAGVPTPKQARDSLSIHEHLLHPGATPRRETGCRLPTRPCPTAWTPTRTERG